MQPGRLVVSLLGVEGLVEQAWAESYIWLVARMSVLTRNRAEAEDAVAEAFARALTAWPSGSPESPRAWLLTTALNVARSRHRRLLRGLDLQRRIRPDEVLAGLSPDRVAVITALRTLPRAQQETLVLQHLADLPVDEVARILGAPVGTVKARLSRGRNSLEALLADAELRGLDGDQTLTVDKKVIRLL